MMSFGSTRRNIDFSACCILLSLAFLLCSGASNKTDTDEQSQLDVRLEVTQPIEGDQSNFVLATLHNSFTASALTDLGMQLYAGNVVLEEATLATLRSGQYYSARFSLPINQSNPSLLINYKVNDQSHSVVRAIVRPPITKKDTLWPTILPVISGLIGTLVGAWVANCFASRREEERARFEWSKVLFEKYEKAYRDFLRKWGMSTSSRVLTTQFDLFQENALVPLEIRDAFERTYIILSNSSATVDEKQVSCANLYQTVERFIRETWHQASKTEGA